CCSVEWLRESMAAAQIPNRFPRSSGAPGRRVRATSGVARSDRTAALSFLRTATRRNARGRCRFQGSEQAAKKADCSTPIYRRCLMLPPVSSKILEHVQGGGVRPLYVVGKQKERCL